MELRQLFSYRVVFWIRLLAGIVVQIAVAWFLWQSIFQYTGKSTIGGMDLSQMMFYYFLVPLISGVTAPDEGEVVSSEIYTGALTKYLIYPLNYFFVAYSRYLATFAFGLVKLIVGLSIYRMLWSFPGTFSPSIGQLVSFVIVAFLATTLNYTLAFCVEICSFWVDVVWNLRVMVRFMISLCGGAMLPLSLFSPGTQHLLEYLPFHYLYSFPIRILSTPLDTGELILGIFSLVLWCFLFIGIAHLAWRRGQYRYTGVGI